MTTDTVSVEETTPTENVEQTQAAEPAQEEQVVEETKEQQVPLAALQKERRKRQESEAENRILKEYGQKQPVAEPEADETQYEAITKGEYKQQQASLKAETLRDVEERMWIKSNPEKLEEVNENLSKFLKQRPNLVSAINASSNRYEEAWELMDKLTPKQKIVLKQPAQQKKDTPGSPGSIPKAAGLNEAVDVMNMSDSDFATWRQSKRRR